ncbi:retrovirus-related pol polyprotein from transposon TNT 1-94 [Tanacetum coccineum]
MPSFPSPELEVSYFNDLDYFKYFENEFSAIVYNDALTSKLDFLTEPTVSPQHIDEFDLNDETSLSKFNEEEENILNFNDLFPFNVIYPNDSKSDKGNDNDKVDIEHSSRDLSVKPLHDVINTDDDKQDLSRLSAEQKYFTSSFIPSDKNSNATPSILASMPNQLKPIVNELQFYFEFFKTLFQRDIKEMKDVFESTESELCELEKQNDFLKDQLLEVSLKHEVELSVLLNHECVDNSLHAEIEQLKKKSIEIQEGLQARIKILEKDVQRCEKQSVDFELKLQHEKEKHKWDSSFKNKNTNPLDYSWISKMEKLEDENVSLDFTVQSLIKERDNVKLEYQKLFNSIKKTRSQTQTEMDELIAHVSEKTYAYGAIRAENQNLLFTISELKTRLANVEKGKSVNTKFDKTNGSQPLLCVTPLHKHVIQKKTDVQKSEENHVVSKPVTLQTSPAKQRGVNSNKNVIAPGMYKVVTTHESQTNEAKHDLSSTGMNAASSVRRPMNRDSHVKNSVLANSKKPAKKVAVYVRKNKQTDITSENVISNKENVIDVDVANARFSHNSRTVNVSMSKEVREKSHDLWLSLHIRVHFPNTSSYYVDISHVSWLIMKNEYQLDVVHNNLKILLHLFQCYVRKLGGIVEGSNAPNETGNVQRTLRTSSSGNTSTVQCYNCSGKGHYARNCPKPRVRDSKYFMEQMLLAKQDEAGVILTDEQNDFLFADASRMEEIEELSANICLMARIHQLINTSDAGPSYDSAFISEVQSSSNNENEEQMYPTHTKIINSTIGDDQIDSDIIFDSPNRNNSNATPSIPVSMPSDSPLIIELVCKTRFSKESTLSKSLDTTYVVSKPKIDVGSTLKASDKVVQIVLWIVDSGCSKHMTGDQSLLRNSWAPFALEMIILQQSQAMVIIYRAISLFVMYIMLKALDIISLALDNFVMAI